MPENTLVSPFLSSFMTVIFIFSTIYTVVYYFNQGLGQGVGTEGIGDEPPSLSIVSTTGSFIDALLEGASWISPFAAVKLLLSETMASTPQLYSIINLLVLRPVGWILFLFTINFILAKIPTMSGEI